MHSPSAHALCNLKRYCIILVHTLKHLKSAKCVINITYGNAITSYSMVVTSYSSEPVTVVQLPGQAHRTSSNLLEPYHCRHSKVCKVINPRVHARRGLL